MQRVTRLMLLELELPDSPAPVATLPGSTGRPGEGGRTGRGVGTVAAEARLEEGMTGKGKKTVPMWQLHELLIGELASSSGFKRKFMQNQLKEQFC